MDRFHDFMMRYTLGLVGLIAAYCKWAEGQAKSQNDALYMAFLVLRAFAERDGKR